MKKNIIKFIIIFSLIFSISNSNVFAQFSKKISSEQLEKLLTENYILINGRFGSFKWEFNKDKTYYVTPRHDKTFQMPNNGTWEITGIFGSSLILTDRQQIINGRNIKYQFFFGEDGYIYTGSERMHSYGLENIQEKINKEARLVEEKRVAEELRLKKIEEEKKQLAIKREQERIKTEQIKKEQERIKLEFDEFAKKIEEERIKNEEERIKKEKKEQLYNNILFLIGIAIALSIFYYINKFHKDKAKNLYLKLKKSLSKIFNTFKIESFDKKIFDIKKLVLFLFGLVFFGFFTFYFVSSNKTTNFSSNIISFSKKNELDTCKDAYFWLQAKIDTARPGSWEMSQYKTHQSVVASYYDTAQKRIENLRLAGREYTIDTNMINLCERLKIK